MDLLKRSFKGENFLPAPTRIKDSLGLDWLVLEAPRYFDGATGQKILDAVKKPIEAGVVRFGLLLI